MTEYITIKGARENNLKGVSVRTPRRQITVVDTTATSSRLPTT